jgi:predicted PhzF superfamily epimerase YddE/YHI9
MNPDFETLKISMYLEELSLLVLSVRPEYDFILFFFVPSLGIIEDPVTGSAHCVFGPYWQKKLNKSEFTAYQVRKSAEFIKIKIEILIESISVYSGYVTDGVLLVIAFNKCRPLFVKESSTKINDLVIILIKSTFPS